MRAPKDGKDEIKTKRSGVGKWVLNVWFGRLKKNIWQIAGKASKKLLDHLMYHIRSRLKDLFF